MTLSEKRAQAGRKGGLTTLARYGIERYKELGKHLPHARYPTLAEIQKKDSSNSKGGRLTGRALELAAQKTIDDWLSKRTRPGSNIPGQEQINP
jgi:hypothetical protein